MIYVVGCNHGIQQEFTGDTQERTEQRSCFARLIEDTIREGKIQLVAEEWDHNGGTTIARVLATEHRVPWVNINTTPADLKRMGIHPFYTKLPLSPGGKTQHHRQREQFMLEKIKENRGEAENLSVICGFDHMLPLSEQLRAGTAEVKTIDYRECDWYLPGVFADC